MYIEHLSYAWLKGCCLEFDFIALIFTQFFILIKRQGGIWPTLEALAASTVNSIV
jgi:hypothetical protein